MSVPEETDSVRHVVSDQHGEDKCFNSRRFQRHYQGNSVSSKRAPGCSQRRRFARIGSKKDWLKSMNSERSGQCNEYEGLIYLDFDEVECDENRGDGKLSNQTDEKKRIPLSSGVYGKNITDNEFRDNTKKRNASRQHSRHRYYPVNKRRNQLTSLSSTGQQTFMRSIADRFGNWYRYRNGYRTYQCVSTQPYKCFKESSHRCRDESYIGRQRRPHPSQTNQNQCNYRQRLHRKNGACNGNVHNEDSFCDKDVTNSDIRGRQVHVKCYPNRDRMHIHRRVDGYACDVGQNRLYDMYDGIFSINWQRRDCNNDYYQNNLKKNNYQTQSANMSDYHMHQMKNKGYSPSASTSYAKRSQSGNFRSTERKILADFRASHNVTANGGATHSRVISRLNERFAKKRLGAFNAITNKPLVKSNDMSMVVDHNQNICIHKTDDRRCFRNWNERRGKKNRRAIFIRNDHAILRATNNQRAFRSEQQQRENHKPVYVLPPQYSLQIKNTYENRSHQTTQIRRNHDNQRNRMTKAIPTTTYQRGRNANNTVSSYRYVTTLPWRQQRLGKSGYRGIPREHDNQTKENKIDGWRSNESTRNRIMNSSHETTKQPKLHISQCRKSKQNVGRKPVLNVRYGIRSCEAGRTEDKITLRAPYADFSNSDSSDTYSLEIDRDDTDSSRSSTIETD